MHLKTPFLVTAFVLSMACLPATATSLDPTSPSLTTGFDDDTSVPLDFQADSSTNAPPSSPPVVLDTPSYPIHGRTEAFAIATAPEPGTLWLMGSVLVTVGFRRRLKA